MYSVRVKSGSTWNQIKSYGKWSLNPLFIRFVFDDGKELIIPYDEIINIQQK